jgi:hypothetical protein
MGEVWKARDTRLGRDVAIKVLPEEFAAEPERRQRFEREARAMASLSHPNVISIFDVGVHEKGSYIVEELLEGESLRGRLGNGPLPWRTAVEVAAQIARGLAAAHERGIVHRDLKPENVFVSPGGTVKVLDFGLARRFEPGGPDQAETLSHLTAGATETGHVLGTVGYMAPEQLRGQTADSRADIFALGVVLHEMISGANPFRKQTAAETFSALLNEDPSDLSVPPLTAPPALARLEGRLLEKNPARRFQSAADAAFALESLGSGAATLAPSTVGTAPGTSRARVFGFAGAVLLAAVAGLAFGIRFGRPPIVQQKAEPRIFRVGIEPETAERGDIVNRRSAVVSPNGRMVAVRRNSRLWLRELGSLALRELPETLGAQDPFWSPDSAAIAFWDGRRLRRVGAAGGAVSVIGEPEGPGTFRFLGGTWGTAGTILAAVVPGGVFRVAAQGGRFEPALKPDTPAGEQDFHSPFFLPDGKSFLFVRHMTGNMRTQLCVWHEGQRRPVLKGVSEVQENPFYSPEGFVLYDRVRRGKAIMAVPFSAESCEATGEPFVVLEDATGATVSSDGTLAAVMGRSARPMELVRVGRDGALLGTVGEPMDVIRNLALSRDGSQVAHSGVVDGSWDIWSLDMGRGGRVRITTSENAESYPAWSRAGDLLAFGVDNGKAFDILGRRSDGTGPVQTLVDSRIVNGSASFPEFSPDDTKLLFNVKGQLHVVDLAAGAGERPRPWPERSGSSGSDGGPAMNVMSRARISPNGRFVAYTSSVTDRPEVYVRPFPGGTGQWTVSVEGGASPLWSPRGDELFFLAGNTLMVSSVETAGAFRAAKPRVLIDGDRAGVWFYSFISRIPSYEVTRDAREFLAVRPVGGDPNELLFYENWSAAFRK